jgi:hypothetical protein
LQKEPPQEGKKAKDGEVVQREERKVSRTLRGGWRSWCTY